MYLKSALMVLTVLTLSKAQKEFTFKTWNPEKESISYSPSRGVLDHDTRNVESAWGTRGSDIVTGHYSFAEPDGPMRNVQYEANPKIKYETVGDIEPSNDKSSKTGEKIFIPPLMTDSYGDYDKIEFPFVIPEMDTLTAFKGNVKPKELQSIFLYPDFPHSIQEYTIHHHLDDNPKPRNQPKVEYTTIKTLKRKILNPKNKPSYSKIIELDLTKAFNEGENLKPTDLNKISLKKLPNPTDDVYTNDHKNNDIKNVIYPLDVDSHFEIPKLIETGFQPLLSLDTGNIKNINDLQYHQLLSSTVNPKRVPTFGDLSSLLLQNTLRTPNIEQYTTPKNYDYFPKTLNKYSNLYQKNYRFNPKITDPNYYFDPIYNRPSHDIDSGQIEFSAKELQKPKFTLDFHNYYENRLNKRRTGPKQRKNNLKYSERKKRRPVYYPPEKLLN